MTDDERAIAIGRGLAVAKRVANLYTGHAQELPDTGILLRFTGTDLSDRGFEVACAACAKAATTAPRSNCL